MNSWTTPVDFLPVWILLDFILDSLDLSLVCVIYC